MDKFAKKALPKLRHYAAHLGILAQGFNPGQDFSVESFAHMRCALFLVPASNRFQIRYG